MNKRLLLLTGNYFPEPTGIGKYNLEMTSWMADNGFNVTVIATYPYYPYWKVQAPYSKKHKWYQKEFYTTPANNRITIYRCPHYVPANPSGLKRIMLDFSFSISAFFQIIKLLGSKKFDFIITVIPPLPLGFLSVLYKKMKRSKFLYHIQDLQIEAARDLEMIKSPAAIRTLFKAEKFILKNADVISSISEGMIEKIQEKTHKKVALFPNWANLEFFYPIAEKDSLKIEFGFSANDQVVLYSGSIGEKQGLEAILSVAKTMAGQMHTKFVICGSGPYKEKLEKLASESMLPNVIFFPLQPLESFNKFLNMADVHLVIQKANASDLVMPSKLTNILAIGGLALVTANENSSLHKLITKYNMGIVCEAENDAALADAIGEAVKNNFDEQKKNARIYAENYLSINKVMETYVKEIRK